VIALSLPPSAGFHVACQSPVVVPTQPTCPRCRIDLTRVVTLGTRDDAGSIPSKPFSIARDSQHRYYVVAVERPGPTFVYDSGGHFLRRLGGEGEGPGEFVRPRLVLIAPGDTILVFDEALGRETVFSPSHQVIRTAPVPQALWSGVVLQDGTIALNADVRDRERIGLPIHAFDRVGNYLRSFGSDKPLVVPSQLSLNLRWLAPANLPDMLWVAPEAHRYVIELWGIDGRKRKALERKPPWFRPYEAFWSVTPDAAPAPLISGLWQDRRGYVWVVLRVPDVNWKRGLGRPVRIEGQRVFPVDDPDAVYDTVIEVIDPARGRVVAYQRFPQRLELVVAKQELARLWADDDGWFHAEIWRVSLSEP